MQHAPPPKRHPYDQWTPDARALDLVGDKWTLLIIRDLAAGPRRFVELQRLLPGISTEQLRSRLNRMVADGMLTRRRFREVLPRVEYELTERSRDLMPAIGELARWGYAWTWSAPREGEQIDIDAIFRLAPGMARLPDDVRGRLELDDHGRQRERARHGGHDGRGGRGRGRGRSRGECRRADQRPRGSVGAGVHAGRRPRRAADRGRSSPCDAVARRARPAGVRLRARGARADRLARQLATALTRPAS